jgi:chaperonin GroES
LQPLFDRVIIRRVKPQEKTSSGILIPEKAQSLQNEGVVVSVGPGAIHPQTGQRIPLNLQEGDKVLLPQYGGSTVQVGSEELLVLKEADIIGKFSA